MIRHHVLLRFKTSVSAETKQGLYAELKDLQRHLDGVLDVRTLPNISVEPELISGFKDIFWFDFADAQARDAYIADPLHQAIGARILAQIQGGAAGIIIVDVEL